MTPPDSPDDDRSSDEPIRPEVVDGGGGPDATTRPGRPATGRMFRIGCFLLVALGAFELFFAAPLAINPDNARCTAARFQINEANDDDETFNDIELPQDADDADDIPCDEAIDLAGTIPDNEDEPADGTFTEAATFRTQGVIFLLLGLGHGLSGFFTLRTRTRRNRTVALIFTALGLVFPTLGLFSMVAAVFVVYALLFSADARVIFGPASGGLFRPRPPRTTR